MGTSPCPHSPQHAVCTVCGDCLIVEPIPRRPDIFEYPIRWSCSLSCEAAALLLGISGNWDRWYP